MTLRLGVIADDYTGATDIAGFFVGAGMQTIQLNSPQETLVEVDAEAVVIGLKTRSIPAVEAVAQSLSALRILTDLGAEQFIFKYCSTFDSTSSGNIGPVTDALLDALGEAFAVVVPALPVNGRTVYQGNLFVDDQPLAESGMRKHPVNPMTDSNLLRLMDAQSAGTTALVPYSVVEAGTGVVREAVSWARETGARYAVVDTLNHAHLDTIGVAVADHRLVTGGSGIGSGLARALTGQKGTEEATHEETWQFTSGSAVVLSGSDSEMTNAQVEAYRQVAPYRRVEADCLLEDQETYLAETRDWVLEQLGAEGSDSSPEAGHSYAPLVYATAPADQVKLLQQRHGAERLSAAIEHFFARLATALHDQGVTRFITAGGETSGAVTQALGIEGFRVGPQIAPGVPWVCSLEGDLDLALKSGNFGEEDFFRSAQDKLVARRA